MASAWTPERRSALSEAFARSGVDSGGETLRLVVAELDRYTSRWRVIDDEVCQAAPSAARAAQQRCLQQTLRELGTLTAVLGKPEPAVVRHAIEAAYALPDPEDCGAGGLGASRAEPARDPQHQTRVDELRGQLAEARAYDDAGQYPHAVTRSRAVLVEAEQLGERGLLAESELTLGVAEQHAADFAASEHDLDEAALTAEAAGRDDLRAMALSRLVALVGVRQRRIAEGEALARRADAVVERLSGEPRLKTELLRSEALLAGSKGDEEMGVTRYQQALELTKLVDDPLLSAALVDGLGRAFYDLQRYAESLQRLDEALAARERLLGTNHPLVSHTLNNLALVYNATNRPQQALPLLRRSLAIVDEALDKDHSDVAVTLAILAESETALRQYTDAEAHLSRALHIMEKVFGPESPNVTMPLGGLEHVYVALHRYADAQQIAERMLTIKEHGLSPDHPELVQTLNSLAEIANLRGDYRGALRHEERALSLLHADRQSVRAASVLINLGHTCGELGMRARAIESLQKAIEIVTPQAASFASLLAEARFDLAMVLVGKEPAHAQRLAEQALEGYRADGAVEEAAKVQRWLATQSLD
jgi:tetratricopeptide (TPR) repeat protein